MSDNEEYEENTQKSTEINDGTKKLIQYFFAPLKYFSLVIILFLIASYLANKYIAGIGMNFIPMFYPVGKSFSFGLANIFHKPLTQNQQYSEFFKTDDNGTNYYQLLDLGGDIKNIVFGLFQFPHESQVPTQSGGGLANNIKQTIKNKTTNKGTTMENISTKNIYLPDYDSMYWYQKIIVSIFGSIQILIGTALTFFSAAAYLFSGKHGMFLNMAYDEKISRTGSTPNQPTPSNFKQYLSQKVGNLKKILPKIFTKSYFGVKTLDESVEETGSDKILLQSGWTKFSAFVDFLYYIPVDKMTYGTNFFIEEPSTFKDRFKYFFLICFVGLLIGLTRGSFSGGSAAIMSLVIVLIIIFVFFAGWVLNPEKNLSPIANYNSLLEKYNKATGLGLNYTEYAQTIQGIKGAIEQTMKQHSLEGVKLAKDYGYKFVGSKPINNVEEQLERNLGMSGGGKIKVKPQYRKKISEIRKKNIIG